MQRNLALVFVALALTVGCEEGTFEGFDGSLFPDEDAGATGGSGSLDEDDAGASPDSGAGGAGGSGGASGSGGAGGTGGGSGPDADQYAGLLAQAICDALETCLGATLLADQLDGRDCSVLYRNRMEDGDLRYLGDSIDAGLVNYHADEVQACLDGVAALGCDVKGARLPENCQTAIEGTVGANGECTINEDCEGALFCDKGSMASCPGTCAEPQGQGMPCGQNDDAQCDDGLICFMGVCDALGSKGVVCGSGLPGCAPGLVCFDTGAGDECTAVPDLYTELAGDDCDVVNGPLCQPPLVCESVSGTMGKCAATVGSGESCKRAVPNQCPVWQYCDAVNPGDDGTCFERPLNGEACIARGSRKMCADEHVCVNDLCRPVNGIGQNCAANSQCYSGDCGDDDRCAAMLMCDAP